MLKNYLLIAIRNFAKYRAYTLINVLGLAVGLASSAIIFLYVQNELAFDRHHKNYDRIYRVTMDDEDGGKINHFATTFAPLAPTLVNEIAEVDQVTRLFRYSVLARPVISREGMDEKFIEEGLFFADSSVTDIFTLDFVKGNPKEALLAPFSLVITERIAQKYFNEEDPIGKTLKLDDEFTFQISGVIKNPPQNTHLQFEMLAPFSGLLRIQPWMARAWYYPPLYTYFTLKEGTDPQKVEKKLGADFIRRNVGEQEAERFKLYVQDFGRIHLYSDLDNEWGNTGNIAYIYILSVIAVFILLISSFNFINLSTAHSIKRAKEVGLRKVLGAFRYQLISQFYLEMSLLVSFAVLLSAILLSGLLPIFNQITQKAITLISLLQGYNPIYILSLLGILILFAGAYPALYLSSFNPIRGIKNMRTKGINTAQMVRKGLVVFQFAISCILITGAWIVYYQINYMQTKKLGLNTERVLTIPLGDTQKYDYQVFQEKLKRLPEIKHTALSSTVPPKTEELYTLPIVVKGEEKDSIDLFTVIVDDGFMSTLDVDMRKGRAFSKDFPSDKGQGVLINESAAQRLGLENPVGQKVDVYYYTRGPVKKPSRIVGVIKDFHFRSLHHKIEPLVFFMMPYQTGYYNYLTIKLASPNIQKTIAQIEGVWQEFHVGKPFEFSFLEDQFQALYMNEARFSKVFYYFTLLATFIAFIGLLGLATFSIEQRTKEIGIRKVLGASVMSILTLLLTDFSKLIGLAFLIGAPIAYFLMQSWLQDFAYRIKLQPSIFIFSALSIFLIAWLSIIYHSVKAANINPIKYLRDE